MNQGREREKAIGLEPRLEAVFCLRAVLEGRLFTPIGPDALADPRDRALANRIVTTALRRHGPISRALAETMPKGLPARSGTLEAGLRCALAQLLFLEDIPDHSALDLGVEAIKADRRARHFAKLANGVLRAVQRGRERFARTAPETAFPDWLVTRWREQYGAQALQDFADALHATPPLDLTLKARDDAALIKALDAQRTLGASVRLQTRNAAVADLPGYAEGAFWVQDTAAAIPATLLNAGPGRRVLDIGAAPGGKTAQLCATGAAVTALDSDAHRLERVAENLARLDLRAALVAEDVLAYAPTEKFDAILLDAPCSATGTFRRHPEVLLHRNREGIAARAALQRTMLAKAAALLAPGGTLIYCVCSLEREEGEEQAAWLGENRDLGLVHAPIAPHEGPGWQSGLDPRGDLRTHPGLALPGAVPGALDGFFATRWTRPG